MISLLIRNLIFTILQPGVTAVLLPYLILRNAGQPIFPEVWTIWRYIGAVLIVTGASVVFICILRLATEGRGTLSPLDPTKKLVIHGLYRYSRNPMYVGAIVLLIGEALFFMSWLLAAYTALLFLPVSTRSFCFMRNRGYGEIFRLNTSPIAQE
jgi:protein-S-isoprenylcysteine O-methyltransferase Ste14